MIQGYKVTPYTLLAHKNIQLGEQISSVHFYGGLDKAGLAGLPNWMWSVWLVARTVVSVNGTKCYFARYLTMRMT